jgi:hypothetical protein
LSLSLYSGGWNPRSTRHCGHQWPIVPAPGDYDDGEFGGMFGRGNRSTRRKPAPVPLCPPQNPHDCPDANPGRRGGKPATNRLSYGTALSLPFWIGIYKTKHTLINAFYSNAISRSMSVASEMSLIIKIKSSFSSFQVCILKWNKTHVVLYTFFFTKQFHVNFTFWHWIHQSFF